MSRLEELLLLWHDQTITEQELAELKALLANPEGRAKVAEDFFLTGVVLESLRTQQAASQLAADAKEQSAPLPRQFAPLSHRRLLWVGGLAVAVLIAVGGVLWFRMPPAISGPIFAHFEQVQGDTFIVSQQQKRPAHVGQHLTPGQGIATQGANSEAVVQLEDAVRLTLGRDTMVFTTTEADRPVDGGPRVVLEQGELFVQVTRSLKKKKMTVQTPLGTAVAEAEDTALHVSDAAGVVVVRGEVQFVHTPTGKAISIKGGQYLVVTHDGELYAAQLFAGVGQGWAQFPQSGLDTNALGFSVAFSPDSKRLASVGRTVEGGGRIGPVDGSEPANDFRGERSVSFSPDGRSLATLDQTLVVLHDAVTGQPLRTLKSNDFRSRGTCLAFSPDGKTLAVGRVGVAWRDQGGVVELWDVETGTLRHICRGHTAAVTCLAFSANGPLASGSLDKTIVLWDPATGQERTRALMTPAMIAWTLVFASDGKTLVIGTGPPDFRLRVPGEIKLWDVVTETVRTTFRGHSRAVTSAIFSPDAQTLITGSADTTVRFWDVNQGREYGMLKGHQAALGFEALGVAMSPDGNWLATVSFDRTVKVWKTAWVKNEAGSRISTQARLEPPTSPRRHSIAFLSAY